VSVSKDTRSQPHSSNVSSSAIRQLLKYLPNGDELRGMLTKFDCINLLVLVIPITPATIYPSSLTSFSHFLSIAVLCTRTPTFNNAFTSGKSTANATTDGISDGSNDNVRAPFILHFGGLTDSLHTIKITVTTANIVSLDYFGNLKSPRFSTPLFMVQAPKMNATGYATAPALATDSIINQLNSELTNVIAEFSSDYPIINAKTNDYYNIITGISADNIHPNDTGYRQIYSAILNSSNSIYVDKPNVSAVKQISSATTLTDLDNGLVIILTASCTVTIPNGLVTNFECTLVTLAGATLTIVQGGSVTLLNNAGTTMAEKLSFTLKNTLTTNQYLTVGNL